MTKNLTKILVVFAGFILSVIFIIGIIQSIQLNNLLYQQVQIQKESEQVIIDYEFTQNPDYQNAYERQEGSFGNENDVIYK